MCFLADCLDRNYTLEDLSVSLFPKPSHILEFVRKMWHNSSILSFSSKFTGNFKIPKILSEFGKKNRNYLKLLRDTKKLGKFQFMI